MPGKVVAIIIITAALIFQFFAACRSDRTTAYKLEDDKSYEASLFRQHCSICHGTDGNGKILEDGTKVPSLRTGPFKFNSEAEIEHQISEGGHGMTPFRTQLTEREIRLLTDFVRNKLRARPER